MARQATPQELAKYREFKSAVINGRPTIRAWLGAVECMASVEQWRRNQVASGMLRRDVLPPVFTAEQIVNVRFRVAMWNKLERALAGLESRRLTFDIRRNEKGQPDIWVFEPTETMLGGGPLIGIAGLLIVAAGIITVVGLVTSCETDARKYKRDLALLDARMAHAPKAVRDAYGVFRASTDFTEPKSAWDDLTEGIKGIGKGAGMILLVIGGIWAFSQVRQRWPSRDVPPAPNPCGPTAPEDWDVAWSDDPEKAERQLEHVLDSLRDRSLAKRWEGYFAGLGDYYGAGDEVPF